MSSGAVVDRRAATSGPVRSDAAPEVLPGESCPTCERRMPFPKQPSSPVTKTTSYRVPVDEVEAHKDVLTTAAKFLGCYERPHWQYATHTIALALVLQDESLKGYAQRGAL